MTLQHSETPFEAQPKANTTTPNTDSTKKASQRTLKLTLPNASPQKFRLRFSASEESLKNQLQLPRIRDNTGRDDYWQLIKPKTAEIIYQAKNQPHKATLPRTLKAIPQSIESIYHWDQSNPVHLSVNRYSKAQAPKTILESMYFYTSYAENGKAISVIKFCLPKGHQENIKIKALKNAQVWSLKVNAQSVTPLTQKSAEQTYWVIPIKDGSQENEIEFTYITQHPRLTLEGRLPIELAETQLAAHTAYVAIGLAERLELVALEADLDSSQIDAIPNVPGFSGKPHVFQNSLYRGEALSGALFYKEPLHQEAL